MDYWDERGAAPERGNSLGQFVRETFRATAPQLSPRGPTAGLNHTPIQFGGGRIGFGDSPHRGVAGAVVVRLRGAKPNYSATAGVRPPRTHQRITSKSLKDLGNRDQKRPNSALYAVSVSVEPYPASVAIPANSPSGAKVAAFFDLDKTIIAKSSALVFSRRLYRHGFIGKRAMLRSALAHVLYRANGADDDKMEQMRRYAQQLIVGWDVNEVRALISESVEELIAPLIYAEAQELITRHQSRGHDVVIVSSSGVEIVEPIAERLGIHDVIATRMRVYEGRYTGEMELFAVGEAKAQEIARVAVERNYNLSSCYAYSDSISDAPMLHAVGHAHAVNPDRSLRILASENGWPIMEFRHPVPIRQRFSQRKKPLAALAIAGMLFAGTGYLLWRQMRANFPDTLS